MASRRVSQQVPSFIREKWANFADAKIFHLRRIAENPVKRGSLFRPAPLKSPSKWTTVRKWAWTEHLYLLPWAFSRWTSLMKLGMAIDNTRGDSGSSFPAAFSSTGPQLVSTGE
jgi:hypothetical protein